MPQCCALKRLEPKPQLKFSVIEYIKSNGQHNDKKLIKTNNCHPWWLVVGSIPVMASYGYGIMDLVIQNGIYIFKILSMDIIPLLHNYLNPLLVCSHSFKLKIITTYIFSLKLIYVIANLCEKLMEICIISSW